MTRFLLAAALVPMALGQNLPAFQWIQEVDSSGTDSFAGLGVDAAGNTYTAGSTYSPNFPVKSAVQGQIHSAGLYRIDGPGSAYAALGLSSAAFVAVDPQNPNTLYAIATSPAVSQRTLLKSVNGGTTFTPLSLPSANPETLAIDPSNDQILYLGTFDQGLLKSSDGGATWTPSNGSLQPSESGEFFFQGVWIDPNNPSVIFAYAIGNFYRSGDGGATWQMILSSTYVVSLSFDTAVPGLIYIVINQGLASVSTDDGNTFTSLTTPTNLGVILPDPNHSGRLIGSGIGAIYQSTDGGNTWTPGPNLGFRNDMFLVADWANGYLYTGDQSVIRITADLQTATPVGPPSIGFLASLAAANGHVWAAVAGTRDVYVTKLDPSGNIVYSTYFGGAGDDIATAVAVDPAGDIYVTGATTSLDFPVTKGVYATTGSSFLFKLNPDGSVAYSTYFAPGGTAPSALAIDASGSAYLSGSTLSQLPTTPGAYQTQCNCNPISTGFFSKTRPPGPISAAVSRDLTIISYSGFITKFDPAAATLAYSTYIGGTAEFGNPVNAFAVGPDGAAYLGTNEGLLHLNATGTALLGSIPSGNGVISAQSIGVAPDGSVYIAGAANSFATTPGVFQQTVSLPASLPGQGGGLPATVIAHYDSQLANVLAATFFGGGRDAIEIAFDSSGNVYFAGWTPSSGLPTRTPLQLGFAAQTGFVSELSGDLSRLVFSSYFGDAQEFTVEGLAVRKDGNVLLGGVTGMTLSAANGGPYNIWVNSVTPAAPPALRIDSVQNAASLLDGPVAAGETIVVQGAGFGSAAQLLIGGLAVQPISMTSTSITATVPQSVPAGAAEFQVTSGGASSNQVLVPVNVTAPGIFSQNGSGFGQGYIFNKNGTLNTPSNPGAPGDPITVFATGAGPVSIDQGYAVSQYPVDVYIDGFFCDGIEAFLGPVPGLPGNVFQIQVFVPNPATLVSANPNLKGFVFPPLVGVTMTINGVTSQSGISFSIAQ